MYKEQVIESIDNQVCIQEVDDNELTEVKATMRGIISFEDQMPKLNFDIIPRSGHYMLHVKGWTSEFSMRKFHSVFLDENKRAKEYNNVMDVFDIPELGSKDGPLLKFKLSRSRGRTLKGTSTKPAHRGERSSKRSKKGRKKKKRAFF